MTEPDVLAVFGDSWVEGSELPNDTKDQDCFAGQLAKVLGSRRVLNFGEPGSSISAMQFQLHELIKQIKSDQKVTAVFFITGSSRHLLLDIDSTNDFVTLTPHGVTVRPYQNQQVQLLTLLNDLYYKHFHTESNNKLMLNLNLLALQSRCAYQGIEDYYIAGWETLDLWPEVNRNKIYQGGQKTCADLLDLAKINDTFDFGNNPNITGTHPNRQGHTLIAQALYSMIRDKNS